MFGSELKVAVSPRRGRKPDVCAYLAGAPLPGRSASLVRTPPTILVEILSPGPRDIRRDKVDKTAEYAAFGVRFYWLVDPDRRLVEILELGADGRYALALSACDGARPAPGCEGLVLDLDALWAEVDRLPEEEMTGG